MRPITTHNRDTEAGSAAATPERTDLRAVQVPTRIGRYELLHLVGEGGMARVFRADLCGPSGFRKPVALKLARSAGGLPSEEMVSHLAREARIGALMNHPNVVSTTDFGLFESTFFIALEWVDGWDLQQILATHGALPAQAALEVLQGLCAGLSHAHAAQFGGTSANVVHGDVKPSNVLVDPTGQVKLIDFGAAQWEAMDGTTQEPDISFGTPRYLSPEQAAGLPIDLQSDLFSLGTMAFELVTGERLFGGEDASEGVFQDGSLAAVAAKAAQTIDDIVPGLGSIVQRCLNEIPGHRFPSAGALGEALQRIENSTNDSPSLAHCLAPGGERFKQLHPKPTAAKTLPIRT